MSGRGKARKPAGSRKLTKSARAGLVMPVGRVHRYLKLGRFSRRTSTAASVYLSAVIEYLVAEVNELSGNAAKANKRKTITPRHIMLGVRNDAELNELLKNVHISHGGVLPCIHPSLLKRKSYPDALGSSGVNAGRGGQNQSLKISVASAPSLSASRIATSSAAGGGGGAAVGASASSAGGSS